MHRFNVAITIIALTSCVLNAQWKQCAGPYGGYVNRCVQQGSTLFASSVSDFSSIRAALYKSEDGGRTWLNIGPEYQGATILSANSTYVFATFSTLALYRSSDKGVTWTVCGFENTGLSSLCPEGATVYAAVEGAGVYRSTNNGDSWQLRSASDPAKTIYSICSNGTILIGATKTNGLWKSMDGGAHWISAGFADKEVLSVSCVDKVFYPSIRFEGLFTGSGSDSSWSALGLADQQANHVFRIGTRLFAATLNSGWMSDDSGHKWSQIETLPKYVSVMNFCGTDSAYYCSSFGNGVYRSIDQGQHWTNCGLPTQLIGCMYMQDSVLLAGTIGDGYGVARSTNRGETWDECNSVLAAQNVRSFARLGKDLYLTTVYDVYRSSDLGEHWEALQTTFGQQYITMYTGLLAKDSLLFVCTKDGGVFRSLDSGKTWQACSNGLTTLHMTKMLNANGVMFVGGYAGEIFRSMDNGDSWTSVGFPEFDKEVYGLAVMDSTVFAATFGNGVYKTTNYGESWTIAYGDLVDWGIYDLHVIGSTLYVGTTAHGVIQSTDMGTHWTTTAPGLKHVVAFCMLHSDSTLYVGTIGGSIYHTRLESTQTDVAPEVHEDAWESVHPNPCSDQVHVRFHVHPASHVYCEIRDALGRSVLTRSCEPPEITTQGIALNVSSLFSGTYTLSIHAGSELRVYTLCVMR